MNEFSIIKKYFLKLTKKNRGSFNLSDDVFFDYKKGIAISIDTFVEKTHFLNFKYPIAEIVIDNLLDKKCLHQLK